MHPVLYLASIPSAFFLFMSTLLRALYVWYRLRHIPGPIWGAFTSYWDPRNCVSGRWILDLNKASDQYGDIIRVGPNQLITNDAHALLRLTPPKPKYTWGPYCRNPKPAGYLAPSESPSFDEQDTHVSLQPLLVSGPTGNLQIEECVDRHCAWLVNLIEHEYLSTCVEHRPMKLAVVAHRFAMNVLGELLWSQLLRILGQDTVAGTPNGEAVEEFLHQLTVGTEATTAAICTTMTHLLGSPAAYSRLLAEIDITDVHGSLSQSITDTETRRLPYLRATIKEGCRICPAYTAPFFEKIPGGGDAIAGYRIPGGTEIGPNIVGIMRSKKYWGHDAEVFRPERWLEADATALRAMHNTLEVLWTLGKYTFLGKLIVQTVMNKVFPELLRRFDFALLHPLPLWDISNPGFWVTSGPLVRATSRKGAL